MLRATPYLARPLQSLYEPCQAPPPSLQPAPPGGQLQGCAPLPWVLVWSHWPLPQLHKGPEQTQEKDPLKDDMVDEQHSHPLC